MYIKKSNLSNWEIEKGVISYGTIINALNADMVLCNKIVEVDWDLLGNIEYDKSYEDCLKTGFENCNIRKEDLDLSDLEDCEHCPYYYKNNDDYYQFFIIDIDKYDIDKLRDLGAYVTILYSDELDVYVLAVGHYGMSWYMIDSGVKIEKAKENGILID